MIPPYLKDKLCTCPPGAYYAQEVCTDCITKHPDQMCSPPSCRNCGKWPPHLVRDCPNCKQPFYFWFRILLSTGDYLLCWDCSVTKIGKVPHGARKPPVETLPVEESYEALRARLDAYLAKI